VCDDEEKYLVEIEKLIKRQIPKETVALDKPASRSRTTHAKTGTHSKTSYQDKAQDAAPIRRPAKQKSNDPWFDKPYEPASQPTPTSVTRAYTGKKKPVAALLGGLPVNK
jgi:hypothetical protein